jgi:hypothetical protein
MKTAPLAFVGSKRLSVTPAFFAFVQGGIDLAGRIVGQLLDFDAVPEELADLGFP